MSAFADGETRVRIEGKVQDADLHIVQPTSPPTNERLMSLALIADAARGASAAHITAVLPYFGYARQDVRKNPGEPRSAQLATLILRCAGIDHAVVLDLHSPASESTFEMPLVQLQADDLTLPVVRGWGIADLVIVSPDAGGLKPAQRYDSALGAAQVHPGAEIDIAIEIQRHQMRQTTFRILLGALTRADLVFRAGDRASCTEEM